jgi:hypothetical protein
MSGMKRRFGIGLLAAVLAAGATLRAESLRIVPITTADGVVVTFELSDSFTAEVKQAIA